MKKFLNTLHLCFLMGCARTFGVYKISQWDGVCEFAIYEWRGKTYYITTNGGYYIETRRRKK